MRDLSVISQLQSVQILDCLIVKQLGREAACDHQQWRNLPGIEMFELESQDSVIRNVFLKYYGHEHSIKRNKQFAAESRIMHASK